MKRVITLVIATVLLFSVMGSANTPKQSFNDFLTAVKTSDGEKSWDLLSSATQDSFNRLYDMLAEMMMMTEEPVEEMAGITSGKSLWIKAVTEPGDNGMNMLVEFDKVMVTREEINGDKAKLTINSGKTEDEIDLVRENGEWKLDMSKALSPLTGSQETSCPAPGEEKFGDM